MSDSMIGVKASLEHKEVLISIRRFGLEDVIVGISPDQARGLSDLITMAAYQAEGLRGYNLEENVEGN